MPQPFTIQLPIKHVQLGVRLTQVIIALASGITVIGMIVLAVATFMMSDSKFRADHGLDNTSSSFASTPQQSTAQLASQTSSGEMAVVPTVRVVAEKQEITVGEKAQLSWEATDDPSLCVASDDWSGDKQSKGNEDVGPLDKAQNYIFTLTCSTKSGTSFGATSVAVKSAAEATPTTSEVPTTPNTGSGNAAQRPKVTFSVSPTSVKVGAAATLRWSVANNPTGCTAGDSWSGGKAASGSQSTGNFGTAGTRTYSLTCVNGAGSETARVSVNVTANAPVVPAPVVSLSISPTAITAGSAATLSWSVANNPSVCTASGAWSGGKAASGSQSVSQAGSGTFTYTLSCSNSGGSGARSVTLTVNPAPVYCGGKPGCYGRSALAAHATPGNCWSWNGDWVINLSSYAPVHKGGASAGSLESSAATCNHDMNAILRGAAGISGYRDKRGNAVFTHKPETYSNSGASALAGYRVGYYDPAKP